MEHSLIRSFGLVLFFPHLIAGPILRPYELIPQFKSFVKITPERFTLAFFVFTAGLVKKVIFADQLSNAVNKIYTPSTILNIFDYVVGIYGFSIQIYCDFSAYTDMAVGLAMALGVSLPVNFDRPYTSTSVREFWRRWHMTLSRWLRDYIYIPLGGNRGGFFLQARNILITLTIGGLWHGANWTFILWGAIQGTAIVLSHLKQKWQPDGLMMPRWLKMFLTFNFISFTWIMFRSSDISEFLNIINNIFTCKAFYNASSSENYFFIVLITIFLFMHRYDSYEYIHHFNKKTIGVIKWPVIVCLWMLCIMVGVDGSKKFIYFDF